MAGWAMGSFDYTLLLDLVDQKISVIDYVKANYLFLALIVVSILLLLVWFFFCLPKVCCRWYRKCCCCIRERKHQFGFTGRLIVVVVGGIGVGLAFVFGTTTAATEASGINGAQALQCHMYTTVGEMIKGSDPEVEEKAPFIGVSPLLQDIRDLSVKLDTSNPDSLLKDLRDQVSEDFDFTRELAGARGSLKAFRTGMESASLDGSYHICYGCKSIADSTIQDLLNGYEKVLETNMDLTSLIDQMFEEFTFPTIVLDKIIPVNEVERVIKNATDTLAQTQPAISSSLTMTEVVLSLACTFVLLMTILGAIWLAFFFIRSRKTGTKLACVQWNVLCICMFVMLLVAGLVGFVMDILMRGCQYVNTVVVEQDDWSWILDKIDPDRQSLLSPLVDGCLMEKGSGDMIEIFGYKEEFDSMVADVEAAIKDAVANLPAPPELPINDLDSFNELLQRLGWVVSADPSKAPEARRKTFPQFLTSGLQVDDVEVRLTDQRGQTVLTGLKTLEGLVAPWKFAALRPDEEPDEFTIADKYPTENDPFLTNWLQTYTPSGGALAIPGVGSVDAKELMKNAIWWSVEKHKILNKEFSCPFYDDKEEKVVEKTCKGSEVFAYDPSGETKGYLLASADSMISWIKTLLTHVEGSIPKGTQSVTRILLSIVEKVKLMIKGINCKFMRRAFVQGCLIACDQTFLAFYKAARYCAVTAGFLLLWIAVLLIVWRKLKDNHTLQKQACD
ncbi:hypothetical protein BESB_039690 [Besnoitia besnoiti]|uniref:Transmembrane protein n=1 Tax=Besnoitia besnoiti TaxID=94643 RepID=A0A2A9MM87_BESBE|nr:hypothetical protein BESB_039690 [Besnoitia besnoiti]PFH37511.1 hypothetical protein BESB_039690 [Besnoitia besnoiti]